MHGLSMIDTDLQIALYNALVYKISPSKHYYILENRDYHEDSSLGVRLKTAIKTLISHKNDTFLP